jgi:hypothetical protein
MKNRHYFSLLALLSLSCINNISIAAAGAPEQEQGPEVEPGEIPAEQQAARLAAEQQAARLAREQEAARQAREQEAARQAAEKAAAEQLLQDARKKQARAARLAEVKPAGTSLIPTILGGTLGLSGAGLAINHCIVTNSLRPLTTPRAINAAVMKGIAASKYLWQNKGAMNKHLPTVGLGLAGLYITSHVAKDLWTHKGTIWNGIKNGTKSVATTIANACFALPTFFKSAGYMAIAGAITAGSLALYSTITERSSQNVLPIAPSQEPVIQMAEAAANIVASAAKIVAPAAEIVVDVLPIASSQKPVNQIVETAAKIVAPATEIVKAAANIVSSTAKTASIASLYR